MISVTLLSVGAMAGAPRTVADYDVRIGNAKSFLRRRNWGLRLAFVSALAFIGWMVHTGWSQLTSEAVFVLAAFMLGASPVLLLLVAFVFAYLQVRRKLAELKDEREALLRQPLP